MGVDNILVAVDGSDHSKRAIAVAADLAGHYGAAVTVLHAVSPGNARVPRDLREYERYEDVHISQQDLLSALGGEILADAERLLREAGVERVTPVSRSGSAAQVIVDYAEDNLGPDDIIVMGRRGLSTLPALLLGSTPQKVGHLLDRTLITVK